MKNEMKVIRIEKRPKGKDYHEWVIESNREIGLPDGAWVYSYNPPYEFVWVDKSLYRRCQNQIMFYLSEKDEGSSPPHVLCQCGGTAFSLWYGGYSIHAVCVKCGKEEIVYEG